MPHAHIAYRVDYDTLLKNPEMVLQKMSFKILEKKNQVLESLIETKVRFKTSSDSIEQGTCQSVSSNACIVKVGNKTHKVPIRKLIF